MFVCAGVYVMFLTERVSLDAMAAAEEANCEREASVPAGDLEASDGSGRFADGKKGGLLLEERAAAASRPLKPLAAGAGGRQISCLRA